MLLDNRMANVICKAVQAQQRLKYDIHVACVTQVGEPGGEDNKRRVNRAQWHSAIHVAMNIAVQ